MPMDPRISGFKTVLFLDEVQCQLPSGLRWAYLWAHLQMALVETILIKFFQSFISHQLYIHSIL
jgi:hypothetical protein